MYDIYVCTKSGEAYAYSHVAEAMWVLSGQKRYSLTQPPTYARTQLSPGVHPGTITDLNGRVFTHIAGPVAYAHRIPDAYFDPVKTNVDGNPKDVQGRKKAPLHLIPATAQVHLARAFNDGVQKYGQANWREKGVNASVYVAAAQRHLALWYDGGEELADDSKVHHLGHAMACLAIILDAQQCGKLNDDRPDAVPGLADLFKNPENQQ